MAEKLGNGGNGQESYDPETGKYISNDKGDVKGLGLVITGKDDLENASRKIIEENKDKIVNRLKNIFGLEEVTDIRPNPRLSRKEKIDDSRGIDYYLIAGENKVFGLDDKTGEKTRNFSFEIFKSVNGKEVTAWFTNKYKINDLLSFGNLIVDEKGNVKGCEYDFFDMPSLANSVYEFLGITDPETNPDSFLYALGRSLYKNAKFDKKGEIRFQYKKGDKPIEGAYVRIKNKVNDRRGPTVSVTLEIDKDKIRNMCENDEHQFISL